ncbi:MAG: PrsW family intramembrane metalloprotease [Candidatus Liptonbacteria bacterium]|nr:PrsW family intramembrane metalloprotease [Candidatus Liptonbacteria bacterium]
MSILAIIVGFLPGFAWLLFYLKEDLHPEPKRLLFLTFLAGAGFSMFALALQLGFNGLLPAIGIEPLSLVALLVLAAIEECVKFAAAYAAIHNNPEFDEPVDAMIYMVVAALGFATVENIGALYGATPANVAFLGDIFETLSLRFVGATLLHTLTSALVGYFWAVSIRDFNSRRFVIEGLVVATLLHMVFNYLILLYDSFAYPVLFVLAVGFFVLNDFERLNKKTL